MGIGAALLQTYPDGKERPVAYLSKKFTPRQQNWCTIEQECYAILKAIEQWHQYVDGVEVQIQTDHNPLKALNKRAQKSTKCERWRLKLEQYRYTIDHIRGDDNAMSDYLCRSPVDQGEEDPDDYVQLISTATRTEDIIAIDTSTPQIVAAVTTCAQANKILESKAPHVRDEEPGQTKITSKIALHVPDEETDNKNKQPTTVKIDDNMIILFTEEVIREQQRSDNHIQHIVTNIKNITRNSLSSLSLLPNTFLFFSPGKQIKKNYEALSTNKLNSYRAKIASVKLKFDDEISLMNYGMWSTVSYRWQGIKGVTNYSSIFADIGVIAVGVFYQCPAIGQRLYDGYVDLFLLDRSF
ncbi:unnamed protein product [Didymodactylos carnosus]|uniref:Reverse transcriptase RNase H-like domain-containing protein n=1 Tax=Didymodactylos carnosus TaxID=1234261 RepID=A0A8S2FH58_9BILA|nr:unnamed protein product [Didymodactylos carnosus]CAF4257842.1 unnamed protein product [Didymodactylos carnosus]